MKEGRGGVACAVSNYTYQSKEGRAYRAETMIEPCSQIDVPMRAGDQQVCEKCHHESKRVVHGGTGPV